MNINYENYERHKNDLGGFRDISLSEEYNNIFERAITLLSDIDKDKDNDFDTTRKIWALLSPMDQANFKYYAFLRMSDIVRIVQETIRFVEKEMMIREKDRCNS